MATGHSSGGDKGPSNVSPKEENKQGQPSEESDSQHPVPDSLDGSGKTNNSAPIPSEKPLERKKTKDPDSMDLDED